MGAWMPNTGNLCRRVSTALKKMVPLCFSNNSPFFRPLTRRQQIWIVVPSTEQWRPTPWRKKTILFLFFKGRFQTCLCNHSWSTIEIHGIRFATSYYKQASRTLKRSTGAVAGAYNTRSENVRVGNFTQQHVRDRGRKRKLRNGLFRNHRLNSKERINVNNKLLLFCVILCNPFKRKRTIHSRTSTDEQTSKSKHSFCAVGVYLCEEDEFES